jgi:hypothetical protein
MPSEAPPADPRHRVDEAVRSRAVKVWWHREYPDRPHLPGPQLWR